MSQTYAVFYEDPQDPNPNLTLVKRVKARSPPEAVEAAITAPDSPTDPAMVDGVEFMVMYDLEKPMAPQTYHH